MPQASGPFQKPRLLSPEESQEDQQEARQPEKPSGALPGTGQAHQAKAKLEAIRKELGIHPTPDHMSCVMHELLHRKHCSAAVPVTAVDVIPAACCVEQNLTHQQVFTLGCGCSLSPCYTVFLMPWQQQKPASLALML